MKKDEFIVNGKLDIYHILVLLIVFNGFSIIITHYILGFSYLHAVVFGSFIYYIFSWWHVRKGILKRNSIEIYYVTNPFKSYEKFYPIRLKKIGISRGGNLPSIIEIQFEYNNRKVSRGLFIPHYNNKDLELLKNFLKEEGIEVNDPMGRYT